MNRAQVFLLFIFAVVTALLFFIMLPFLAYVIFAIILAYVLYPLHCRLESGLGKRLSDRIAAILSPLLLIIGSIVVLVLPLAYIATRFIRDLREIARSETDLQIEVIEERIADITGTEIDFLDGLETLGEIITEAVFGDAVGLFSTALELALGSALVLFLLFYLLRDGAKLVEWLKLQVPLPHAVSTRLIDQIHRTTWGSVIGHGFAAFVQAVVAGLGLYLVGIPNVVFWTFVMFILAFLPLIGAFLVWAPAAAYLYLIGDTLEGFLLAVYGLFIVSLIDYYVRPIVIDRRARLNPAVLLVGVFGGLYSMGFVGLFVGPITIGVFVALVKTIHSDFDRLE